VVAARLRPAQVVPLGLPAGEALAKLDCLQPTGSFKIRGALAALEALGSPGARIVAASAGNHALAVVEAARRRGPRATVVVPRTASAVKLAALLAGKVSLDDLVVVLLSGRNIAAGTLARILGEGARAVPRPQYCVGCA